MPVRQNKHVLTVKNNTGTQSMPQRENNDNDYGLATMQKGVQLNKQVNTEANQ